MNISAYFGHLNFNAWIVLFTISIEASKKPGKRSFVFLWGSWPLGEENFLTSPVKTSCLDANVKNKSLMMTCSPVRVGILHHSAQN